jgi:hypothetical protein
LFCREEQGSSSMIMQSAAKLRSILCHRLVALWAMVRVTVVILGSYQAAA